VYVVVYWHLRTELNSDAREVSDQLRDCLEGTSWVHPTGGGFYLVRVTSTRARESLAKKLRKVCETHPGAAHLMISPAIEDGAWSGWLPRSMWPKVRQRTQGTAE
jgi:hypothetical protein